MLEDGLGGIRSRKQDGRPFYERWPLQHSQGGAAHGHGDPRCWRRQVQPSISAILSLLRFTAMRECLLTGPASRLGKLMRAETIEQVNEQEVDFSHHSQILELCDEFVPGNPPEFFFDRNPENFPTILNIYRTGQFHMKEGGCALVLQKDLEYWIIGESRAMIFTTSQTDEMTMEPCCALKYYPAIDVCQSEKVCN